MLLFKANENGELQRCGHHMTETPVSLYPPAKAGIHGLSGKQEQQSLVNRTLPAMDSRFRGNDNRAG